MKNDPGIRDITLGTDDLGRTNRFSDALMSLVGLARLPDAPKGWTGRAAASGNGFWLCQPFDGKCASHGNGTMATLRATSAAKVRAFHATALAHGGTDKGSPGTRPTYEPRFYVACVRDPDDHKLARAHPTYNAKEDSP